MTNNVQNFHLTEQTRCKAENSSNTNIPKIHFYGTTYTSEPKIRLQKSLEQDKVEFTSKTTDNKKLINPATGNLIATNIKDLPDAPEGWVTLTHVSNVNKENIINNGLWYKNPYAIDETTCVIEGKKDLIEEAKNGKRTYYGDTYFVFQMPMEEYRELYFAYKTWARYKDNLGYKCGINSEKYGLVVPPYYLVGCLDRKDMERLSKEQVNEIISKNIPPLDIKPTDLKLLKPEQRIEYIPYEEYHHKAYSLLDSAETPEVKYLPLECKGLCEEEIEELLPELKKNFIEEQMKQNTTQMSELGDIDTENVLENFFDDEDWY